MKWITTLVALLLVVGCEKRTEVKPTKYEIKGQVFVVLQNGDNVKMGLVNVSLIPTDSASNQLGLALGTPVPDKAKIAGLEKLIRESETNLTTIVQEQAELQGTMNDHEKTYQRYSQLLSGGGTSKSLSDTWNANIKAATASMDSLRPRLLELEDAKRRAQNNVTAAQGEIDRIKYPPVKSERDQFMKLYDHEWRDAVAKTKTDADGRFYFETDGGDYVLAATATRKHFGGRERYVWFATVKRGEMNFLSNDNMVSHTEKDAE